MPSATEKANSSSRLNPSSWRTVVAPFEKPSTPRAIWQIVNTLVPYAILWVLMARFHSVSWWISIPLAVLAGGFVIRAFIIFHDCGHGSFFKSRKANTIVGFFCGMLTFTPYYHWRWEHNVHHASAGHLDKRGTGDVRTLTVDEYLECGFWARLSYRLERNPFVLFILGPLYLFFIGQRGSSKDASDRERQSVHTMNLAILLMVLVMGSMIGFGTYLFLQFIVMGVAGAAGIWLFYVQHQFEGVYWERGEDWDFAAAALQGSSFYKLPKVFQWFSGNIGFHHVHHLSSRIPNYNLERCHNSDDLFRSVKPITLLSSMKSLTFRLWDEPNRQLVGFKRAREVALERRSEPKQTTENEASTSEQMSGASLIQSAVDKILPHTEGR